jgi:drug/metabolite transporter (DMT)-like permease
MTMTMTMIGTRQSWYVSRNCHHETMMQRLLVVSLLVGIMLIHLPGCESFSIPSPPRLASSSTSTTALFSLLGGSSKPSQKRHSAASSPPATTTTSTSSSSHLISSTGDVHAHGISSAPHNPPTSEDLMVLSSSLTSSMDLADPMVDVMNEPRTETTAAALFNNMQQSSSSSWLKVLDAPSLSFGRFLILLASAIYGTNFFLVKMMDDVLPTSISATLRFGLAAAVVTSVVLRQEVQADKNEMEMVVKSPEQMEQERNRALWAGMEIGFWYCIGYICQAEGLQTVAAGKSAFFNSLAVVIVPLLDVLLRGRVLSKEKVLSILIACAGVGLLELGPGMDLSISNGDILALMQTLFFGIGYWRLESASQSNSAQAARLTVGQLVAVAVGSSAYALAEISVGHVDGVALVSQLSTWLADPFIIGALLWTGLVSTALALYLETVALKVVSASELTLLMTTISLWGAGFAYLALGEVLNTSGMIGGLLIMAGCILGNVNAGGDPAEMDQSLQLLNERAQAEFLPTSIVAEEGLEVWNTANATNAIE